MSDVFQSRICVVAVLTNCEWTVGNKLKKKRNKNTQKLKKKGLLQTLCAIIMLLNLKNCTQKQLMDKL